MKPIILEKDKDGNLQITVDEIKKMVQDAYESGYEDGSKPVPITVPTPYPYPYPYTPTPYTPNWIDRDHIVITCESLPLHL